MAKRKGRGGADDYWVTPNKGGDWALRREGAGRASGVFGTQREAIARGKELASKSKVDLTVQGTNGRIRSKDSYGNDPRSRKDTEH